MSLDEERVYAGTKRFLKNNGFLVLAGQPPRGVDHIPVIEIKDPNFIGKGSRNAYKPDLVAFKNNNFYIIECKPQYDLGDYHKLKSILSSDERLHAFYNELTQRGLLRKNNINLSYEYFKSNIFGVLSYSSYIITDDLYYIKVNNWAKGHVDTNLE